VRKDLFLHNDALVLKRVQIQVSFWKQRTLKKIQQNSLYHELSLGNSYTKKMVQFKGILNPVQFDPKVSTKPFGALASKLTLPES